MSEHPREPSFGAVLLRVSTTFAVVYLVLGFAADFFIFILPTIRDGYIVGVCISLAFHVVAWCALFYITVLYQPDPEVGLLGHYHPSAGMTRYYKVWAIFALVLGIQSSVGHIITSDRFGTQAYALHETTFFTDYDLCCAMFLPSWLNDFYLYDADNRAFFMLLVQILLIHITAFFLCHFQNVRHEPGAKWHAARSMAWATTFSLLSVIMLLHFYHSVIYSPPLPDFDFPWPR